MAPVGEKVGPGVEGFASRCIKRSDLCCRSPSTGNTIKRAGKIRTKYNPTIATPNVSRAMLAWTTKLTDGFPDMGLGFLLAYSNNITNTNPQ